MFNAYIPEALRISRLVGLSIGENVALDDPSDPFSYKLKEIKGSFAVICRPTEDGGDIMREVSLEKVFAYGIIRGLVQGYPSNDIIQSRKKGE